MRLPVNAQILFPNCNSLIDQATLTAFKSSRQDPGPYFWSQHQQYSDAVIFLSLLCHHSPFSLLPQDSQYPLVIKADLARFPYTIDNQDGFAAFAIRLMPIRNRLGLITLSDISQLYQVRQFWFTPSYLVADIGPTIVRLEILYRHFSMPLSQLTPPATFQLHRLTNHNPLEE